MRRQSAAESETSAVQTAAREEVRLLHRIAEGDRRAFETLYRLYHPRLTRFAANLLKKPELVEEVVNDTLLAVWKRPEGYNGTSRLSTWIFAIAYRKALKARRGLDEPMEDKDAENRQSAEDSAERQLGQLV